MLLLAKYYASEYYTEYSTIHLSLSWNAGKYVLSKQLTWVWNVSQCLYWAITNSLLYTPSF